MRRRLNSSRKLQRLSRVRLRRSWGHSWRCSPRRRCTRQASLAAAASPLPRSFLCRAKGPGVPSSGNWLPVRSVKAASRLCRLPDKRRQGRQRLPRPHQSRLSRLPGSTKRFLRCRTCEYTRRCLRRWFAPGRRQLRKTPRHRRLSRRQKLPWLHPFQRYPSAVPTGGYLGSHTCGQSFPEKCTGPSAENMLNTQPRKYPSH